MWEISVTAVNWSLWNRFTVSPSWFGLRDYDLCSRKFHCYSDMNPAFTLRLAKVGWMHGNEAVLPPLASSSVVGTQYVTIIVFYKWYPKYCFCRTSWWEVVSSVCCITTGFCWLQSLFRGMYLEDLPVPWSQNKPEKQFDKPKHETFVTYSKRFLVSES